MTLHTRPSSRGAQPLAASPLDKMVSYRLSRTQAKLNAQAQRILKAHGDLSLMQWRVLVILDVAGASTHAEIARLTGIDRGQLSRSTKGMIAAGLLTAPKDPGDSRQYALAMTDLGRQRFEVARPAMRARQKSLLGAMPAADLEVLFQALTRLEAAAEG